jgi:hypothetical protein
MNERLYKIIEIIDYFAQNIGLGSVSMCYKEGDWVLEWVVRVKGQKLCYTRGFNCMLDRNQAPTKAIAILLVNSAKDSLQRVYNKGGEQGP